MKWWSLIIKTYPKHLGVTELVILYMLATCSFLVMINMAITMTWRVGTGPGTLPVPFGYAATVMAVSYALGLGSFLFLRSPSSVYLIGLILSGFYGLYHGVWRYFRHDYPTNYNPDLIIDPSFNTLVFSAFSCILIIGTGLYFMWSKFR